MTEVTRRSDIDAGVSVYYDKQLLVRAMPSQIHALGAQKKRMPQKNSSHMKFRRYANLSTATVPLSDGVTPNGQKLSKTDITVEIKQYGDYVVITDQVEYLVEDPVLNETAQLLAQQLGETMDELTRDVLEATASVYNCSGGANGDVPTELTAADIREVTRLLASASGKMFTPIIEGTTRVGTAPVRDAFWCMAHTDIQNKLEDVANFLHVSQYPSQNGVLDAEFGATGNMRWLLSPLGSKEVGASNNGSDVYNCFAVAQNAYGSIELTDGMVQNIFKDFGDAGNDRLNQQASLGWKAWYSCVILNDAWIRKIRTTIHA